MIFLFHLYQTLPRVYTQPPPVVALPSPIPSPIPSPTSTPTPTPTPKPQIQAAQTSTSISESDLWTAVTNYRLSHNRSPLVFEPTLCPYARKRVQQHLGRTDLDHHAGFQADADSGALFSEIGGDFINIAEVLAYLPNVSTAIQVIEWGWDSSPAHREGILSNDMTHACFTGIPPFFVGILSHR